MNTDENLQKSWSILDNLKPAEIMEIKRIPENRRDVFIFCAKQYADTHHNITFNNDFTKIRKLSDFCNFDLNNQNISKWKIEAELEKMQVENRNQKS